MTNTMIHRVIGVQLNAHCLFYGLSYLLCLSLVGCSNNLPQPVFDDINYDYIISSPYKLTLQHQNIYFDIDAADLRLPEETLSIPSLQLEMVNEKSQAQVVVYIHVANSFLISRPSGTRKEVIFNEQEKGKLKGVAIQRAHIRTHYNIEVVDVLADSLIDQFSGAGNYPIEVLDYFQPKKNITAMKEVFLAESIVARYEVINTIWRRIKKDYLNNIQVVFAQEKYNLMSDFETEPNVTVAFDLLSENNKQSAVKALHIYNALIKKYRPLEDEHSKAMAGYLDKGISVSTSIANHEHQDRYSPED